MRNKLLRWWIAGNGQRYRYAATHLYDLLVIQYDPYWWASMVGDVLPPLCNRLYNGFKENGFNESQSFKLLQTYIAVALGNNVWQPPTEQ